MDQYLRRIVTFIALSISLQVFATERYILTLADIHFDPFSYCKSRNCPLITKLKEADVKAWASLFKAENASISQLTQDTNYPLLISTLENAQQVVKQKDPDYILILGDFLGHDYRRKYCLYTHDNSLNGYRAFVYKTVQFLSQQIKAYFPAKNLYAAVGNNDTYQGDYISDPKGSFFKDIALLWQELLGNAAERKQFREQFSVAGYYALTLPGPVSARLIMLNSNYFSYLAKGSNVDQIAQQELNWLQMELAAAKAQKQKVILAMHIPQGVDLYATLHTPAFTIVNLWKKTYIDAYNALLATYAQEIMAILAGHLHADWYEAISLNGNDIVPQSGTPAVSPIYGTNPGFKIYTYAASRAELTSFMTYQYPLSYSRIALMEASFNLTKNLRCENGGATSENAATILDHLTSRSAGELDSTRSWSPYYQCEILK
jgi:predicted MPP superfamily phosphohydrolase